MSGSSDVFMQTNEELGTYFNRSEFRCKGTNCDGNGNNCGFDTVDTTLIMVLEYVRSNLGHPVIVSSGCRCPAHNKAVGGSEKSKHMQGRAADIRCPDVMWETLKEKVDTLMEGWGGVGYYQNQGFIHVDTRTGPPARWHG